MALAQAKGRRNRGPVQAPLFEVFNSRALRFRCAAMGDVNLVAVKNLAQRKRIINAEGKGDRMALGRHFREFHIPTAKVLHEFQRHPDSAASAMKLVNRLDEGHNGIGNANGGCHRHAASTFGQR